MTDQEALKYLKDANGNNQMVGVLPKSDIGKCLINALEENQKYRAIGTPEECRAVEWMSRVLPILFNTDMVRAILDGRKTVTRRLIKPQPTYSQCDGFTWKGGAYGTDLPPTIKGAAYNFRCAAPYQPGDILYVRESIFQGVGHYLDVSGETVCVLTNDFEYYADGLNEKDHWKDKHERTWMHRRPSIHMPKEAARIWLKVKDVRVERLQEITEEQAKAEGAKQCYEQINTIESRPVTYLAKDGKGYYILGFKSIWNSTIKKPDIDRYGWDANPWVWVIEFERCEKPEGWCV